MGDDVESTSYHGGQKLRPTCGRYNFCIWILIEVIFALLEILQCVDGVKGIQPKKVEFWPQKSVWCIKLDIEGFKHQITKLGATPKMGLASQFLQFFHLESTKIDDKLFNDSF